MLICFFGADGPLSSGWIYVDDVGLLISQSGWPKTLNLSDLLARKTVTTVCWPDSDYYHVQTPNPKPFDLGCGSLEDVLWVKTVLIS